MLIKKEKGILIIGKFTMKGSHDTTLTAVAAYSITFLWTKIVCLSLHDNGVNSYISASSAETYKFKAKDSEIKLHYV